VKIRPYRENEQEALVRLWHACGLVRPVNDPRKDIARKLRVDLELLLVGWEDETLIASVMVGYDGHRGWLNYFAVAPSHQKQGFGRLLMAEAERLLRERGCAKINLQVRTTNQGVIEFYRTLGFQLDEVVSMGKRLEQD